MPDTVPAAGSTPLIVQICPNDHPPFRDICAVYQAAAESLGARVLTVFFSAARAEQLPGAHYLNVADSGNNRTLVRALRSLLRKQADRKPLLVVCHRYRSARTFVASRWPAHRVVTVAHEFRLLARWQRRLSRRLFARRMLFAGVSPAVQQELAETVPDALCLPNAIDLPRFDRSLLSRSQARTELGLPALEQAPAPFTIGVIGRLIPWKRPQLALSALSLLDAGDEVQLVFVGEGPLKSSLQQAAGSLPVHLAGFRADARRLLAAFDALLVVSEAREAFGMVVLEAMAAGVPVIAGPAPGPRYVLGDAAIFYQRAQAPEIAAAIAQMRTAREQGEAEQLAEQARQRVATDFSIAALASKLDALFFLERA
jgi:glycosyltransferase involved in cell wall biosynthesis